MTVTSTGAAVPGYTRADHGDYIVFDDEGTLRRVPQKHFHEAYDKVPAS